jgi:hypothetical protein
MTTLREAAQQALEFVTSKQWGTTPYMDVRVYEDAARLRDTFRAALEQPEQEPVAWLRREELADLQTCNYRQLGADSPRIWAPREADTPPPGQDLVPVFTHPPRREWRGLTEEEIRHFAWNGFLMAEGIWDKDTEEDLLTFARAIEQACKERNP